MNSIRIQTFKNFEVVITDDSGDDISVFDYITGLNEGFSIRYFKNVKSLGSPGNWNECISHASGTWIKLMHDDYFTSSNSLQLFADSMSSDCDCIFSGYKIVEGN